VTTDNIAIYSFAIISVILLLFAFLVLWKIYTGKISLDGLLAESAPGKDSDNAKASLSRFQFLIFTFVIAGLFLLLSIEAGTFVDIPQNVLILLGISGGTHLVAKSVDNNKTS
jgi:Ca2+/Na+ antiporter